jgi:hypothetical protein
MTISPVVDNQTAPSSDGGDHTAPVAKTVRARITALGAIPVDVGQLDVNWVVLADPEGNEFCVMSEWTED